MDMYGDAWIRAPGQLPDSSRTSSRTAPGQLPDSSWTAPGQLPDGSPGQLPVKKKASREKKKLSMKVKQFSGKKKAFQEKKRARLGENKKTLRGWCKWKWPNAKEKKKASQEKKKPSP